MFDKGLKKISVTEIPVKQDENLYDFTRIVTRNDIVSVSFELQFACLVLNAVFNTVSVVYLQQQEHLSIHSLSFLLPLLSTVDTFFLHCWLLSKISIIETIIRGKRGITPLPDTSILGQKLASSLVYDLGNPLVSVLVQYRLHYSTRL